MHGSSTLAKVTIVIGLLLISIVFLYFISPIPQWNSYHQFADSRALFFINNFGDVASNVGFFAVGFYGLVTQTTTVWLIFVFVGMITILYALPFGAHYGLRYIPTLKIFIVALCWSTLATFGLYNLITFHFALVATKAIIWILVMIVPLEIHDLVRDAPTLKTLPQVLGIRAVKLLSYALILTVAVLALITSNSIMLAGVEIAMLVMLA